jgi:hypothetical protein
MEEIRVDIPAYKVPGVIERLTEIKKRMAKKGLAGILDWTVGAPFPKEIVTGYDPINRCDVTTTENFRAVAVDFDPPKLAGWTFQARIEHHLLEGEYTNLLYATPTAADGIRAKYADAAPDCDHCGYARTRKDTFVVRHEDGTTKQVGTTCLKDFLGIDPTNFLWAAQCLGEIMTLGGDPGEGYGAGPRGDNLWLVLCQAADETLENGYVSRTKAEEWDKAATADIVNLRVNPPKNERRPTVTAAAEELAFGAWWWLHEMAKQETIDNDYYANLATIVRLGYVPNRAFGLAASAPIAYKIAREKLLGIARKKKERLESEHIGTVGKRMSFKGATCDRVHVHDGYYGRTYITTLRLPAGNKLVWFGTAPKFDEGFAYDFDAMVKEHKADNGYGKETIVNRPTKIVELEEEEEK